MVEKKNVCIIIPIYKDSMTDLENFSFQRIIKVFSSRKISIICPLYLDRYINLLCRNNDNITASFFSDRYFNGIVGYNVTQAS